MGKLVVIIQCDAVQKKCSGFACMNSFYERSGKFAGYDDDARYISFTCGGCCGVNVAMKLEHLTKKLRRHKMDTKDVVVHLASCVVSDNYHTPPCPYVDYLKAIVEKKGYPLVCGSYISQTAERKRQKKLYQEFK